MKRHKSTSRMLRNWDLSFWTPVNFEVEYYINEETEGVLTDTVIYFSDQHLTWLSQLKPNASPFKGTNPALKKSSNIPKIYAKMFGRFH